MAKTAESLDRFECNRVKIEMNYIYILQFCQSFAAEALGSPSIMQALIGKVQDNAMNNSCLRACTSSHLSDQSTHLSKLISVTAFCHKNPGVSIDC